MNSGLDVVTLGYADDGYLICRETRLLTHAELRMLFRDLLRITENTEIASILIDCRAQQHSFSLYDAFQYGTAFVQAPLLRFKFALLVQNSLYCRDFLQLVATERGVRLRYFTDPDQARAWLLADDGFRSHAAHPSGACSVALPCNAA